MWQVSFNNIFEVQMEGPKLKITKSLYFSVRIDEALVYKGWLCTSDIKEPKGEILEEVHNSIYKMHPGCTKTYQTFTKYYQWIGMKRQVVEFVSKCLVCQQVKAKRKSI